MEEIIINLLRDVQQNPIDPNNQIVSFRNSSSIWWQSIYGIDADIMYYNKNIKGDMYYEKDDKRNKT